MAVFRFLSAVFLLAATVALVVDATPALYGAGPFKATTLGGHWRELAPSALTAAESAVSSVAGSWAWDGLIAPLLGTPTFLAFGVLAVLSGYAGRRRRSVRIFVN